jgi:DNA-directed RNA polymerase III subunit RPC3
LSRTELAEIEKSAASEIDIERSDLENPTRLLTTRGSGRSGKPDVSLVRDIPVRLNHDRYGILIRDEVICKAVGDRWNQGASITMRATLLASLTEAASLRDSRTPVSVTAGDVIKCLPSAHPAPAGTLMADLVGLSSKSTAEHVRQYLQILAGDDQAGARTEVFLFKPASSSEAKYQVEVERVAKILRQAILLDMVRQQLSNVHARVLSVVMAAQVASEETVSLVL